jgi:hypothetical protein
LGILREFVGVLDTDEPSSNSISVWTKKYLGREDVHSKMLARFTEEIKNNSEAYCI